MKPKFYIENLYSNKNLFDVMLEGYILGRGNEKHKTVEFDIATFDSPECMTDDSILSAAAWCRNLGYKTHTAYEGWVNGRQEKTQ